MRIGRGLWLAAFLAASAMVTIGKADPARAEHATVVSTIAGDDFRAEVRVVDGVIVYDLAFAGPESVSAFVARQFLVEMATFPDLTAYTEVDLAYRGKVRFRIYVGDLKPLADMYQLGEMEAFHRLMKLPSIVQTLDGKYAFSTWGDDSISSLAGRAEDFNKMVGHWYLDELTSSSGG